MKRKEDTAGLVNVSCKKKKENKIKGGNSATSGTSDRDKQFPSAFPFTHARIKRIYARTVSLKNYSRVGRASMNFARGFPSSTANEQHNLSFCSIFLPFLFHFRKRKSRFPVDARYRNVHWINWKIYYGKERCTIISLLYVCLLCFFRGHRATRWYFLSTSSRLRELIKWQAKKNVYTRLMKVSIDSLYHENRLWRDYLLQVKLGFQLEIYEKRKEEQDIWHSDGKIADGRQRFWVFLDYSEPNINYERKCPSTDMES